MNPMTEKENMKDGVVETFYKNGQLKSRENYKGLPNGPCEYFRNNGQLHLKTNYKNGVPHGLWESFYENGQLREKINYINGKRDGLCETFCFKNNNNPFVLHGPIEIRENYKDGKRAVLRKGSIQTVSYFKKETLKMV